MVKVVECRMLFLGGVRIEYSPLLIMVDSDLRFGPRGHWEACNLSEAAISFLEKTPTLMVPFLLKKLLGLIGVQI